MLVQRVAAQSPVADLGIEPGTYHAVIEGETLLLGGDVILEVAGVVVTGDGHDFERIQQAIVDHVADRTLSVRVLRDGQVIELMMK